MKIDLLRHRVLTLRHACQYCVYKLAPPVLINHCSRSTRLRHSTPTRGVLGYCNRLVGRNIQRRGDT